MSKKVRFIASGAVLVFVCICFVFAFYSLENRKTSNVNDAYVIIEKNSSFDKVLEQLKKRKVISSEKAIRLYSKIKGVKGDIPGGYFIIKPGSSYKSLLNRLKSSAADFAVVTIPEGYSFYQIADRLEKNKVTTKDSFLKLSLKDINPGLIDTSKTNAKNTDVIYEMEGFLFPDTYYIPTGASDLDIAKLMYGNFEKVFNESYRIRAKELGLTISQVINIASMIEKEAANDKERSKIAGVIYNRIEKGMLLQIDAAVVYAKTSGEKTVSKVYKSDLKINSRYNTYLYKGLPPGPIASPGRPSIEAALYPEKHEYLYYVLGEEGHVFSKTYEEHVANVKKYIK